MVDCEHSETVLWSYSVETTVRIVNKGTALFVLASVFVIACLFTGNYFTDWNFEAILIGVAISTLAEPRVTEVIAILMNTSIEEASDSQKMYIRYASFTLVILMIIISYVLMVGVLYPRFG